jgi:hypothetical protein
MAGTLLYTVLAKIALIFKRAFFSSDAQNEKTVLLGEIKAQLCYKGCACFGITRNKS